MLRLPSPIVCFGTNKNIVEEFSDINKFLCQHELCVYVCICLTMPMFFLTVLMSQP